MDTLRITSCQAANADPWVAAVVGYLAERLGQPAAFINQIGWEERDRLLDAGQMDVGWICGWPYVRKLARPDANLELLAAPVMAAARYLDQPIYFSDVVVRRDSPFMTFADLRGAAWGYNEPGSQSGFNITRYHLAKLGENWTFFGHVVQTGAHQASLREVRAGRLDATAIDSTVLETELERDPALRDEIRLIGALGPSPIPPWVVSTHLPEQQRQALRAALLEAHTHPAGRAALAVGGLARFAAVIDRDYDAIREMARFAEHLEPPA
ncbi:MAG: PhnD/SsuA/transferrin family substrate-binding protein [Anaerolineales bacterium]